MTKERILDAATELFARKGFDGTRVQEIADAAGVNKAMLYYYFRNKDELLMAVIERFIEGIRGGIPRYFADSGEAAGSLREFLGFHIEYLARNQPFVRLMAWELLSGKHMHIIASKYLIPTFGLLREKIVQAIERGELRRVSPEHAICSVLGMNLFYIIARPSLSHLRKTPGRVDDRKRGEAVKTRDQRPVRSGTGA